jgi:phosphohistidine phosphatase
MKLYLIRHGQPLSREEDPAQPLTDQGRLDVATTTRFLVQTGISSREIWHSEKARSRETAWIIGQALTASRLVSKPGLAPRDPVDSIRAEIMDRRDDLVIVGHLPFLSRLINLLLGVPLGRELLDLQTAELVGMERDPDGAWKIGFAIYPRLLE